MTQRQRRRPETRPDRRSPRPADRRPAPQRPAPRRPAPRGRRVRLGKLRWLIALPLVALIIWLLLTNVVFRVRDVKVSGAQSLSEPDVVRLSGVRLGAPMNAVNLEVVKSGVESSGTLAFVGVEKRYPSTLVINVRERSHDAVILQAGKILVLDSDGCVVSAGESMPAESVPYVTGLKPTTYRIGSRLGANDAALDAMKVVLEAMKAQGATGYASELSVEDVKDIRILTRKGTTVLLGDSDNMPAKIAWMARALQDLESRGENLGRLDVSSGKRGDFLPGATVTPKPRQTQNPFDLSTPTPEPEGLPEALPMDEEGAIIGEGAI